MTLGLPSMLCEKQDYTDMINKPNSYALTALTQGSLNCMGPNLSRYTFAIVLGLYRTTQRGAIQAEMSRHFAIRLLLYL